MVNYKEWIIKYHGDLQQVVRGVELMYDVICEKYVIIKANEKELTYLKGNRQVEAIEQSKQISQIEDFIDPMESLCTDKEKYCGTGKGVTVGWIDHKARVNFNNYTHTNGMSRIYWVHDGVNQYEENEIIDISTDHISSMDMCIGNKGIASSSGIILVNWIKDQFYTADLIRAVRFIISKANSRQKPLVIYIPFDISPKIEGDNNLTLEIIAHMALWGKIAIVSSLEVGSKTLDLNLGLTNGPVFSDNGPVTVGALSLLMEWGIIKGNDPYLYGQRLRTYYLKKMVASLKNNRYTPMCGLNNIERFRALELAYELAPDDAVIDAFMIYNNLNKALDMPSHATASLYSLVFPYLGIRGTVMEIRQTLSAYSETLTTVSLAALLGSISFPIKPTQFKSTEIVTKGEELKGAGTLIGIIDTGIDYRNPAFIDANGKSRIISIWDQTVGVESPYGYGTVYDNQMINMALQSPDPFKVVPHRDISGSGTMLAGIAAGNSKDPQTTFKGAAPEAQIAVVKLTAASPAMQDIYHSTYNPLAFSALDVARGFEFLTALANRYQKPISICLPAGTNSGSHDGANILDTIIRSYAENPGVSMILPAGEEANKKHHASGDLNEKSQQHIGLTIPKGQGGFIVEIWAAFGDRIEVFLTSPDIEPNGKKHMLLNKAQTYQVSGTSYVWSQGSKIDPDTGCQVIRFRLRNPLEGNWTISIKGIVIIAGRYDIWIPTQGMILPETVLNPADPFTTIYNTSAASGLMTVACYDERSLSATASSGRGFARDGRVKPDFVIPAVDIPGPLPGNKWGLITGTGAASAIAIGISSLVYEDQIKRGEVLANTVTMKALLIDKVTREPTMSYPNPSTGYGLLDPNTIVNY